MEGASLLVALAFLLATTTAYADDPAIRIECDCKTKFNQTCENGRGICYYHVNRTEYGYRVCRSYCGVPPDVENAALTTAVTYDNSFEGNVFEYTCTGNYFAREDDIMTIVCPYDGVWTTPSFKCIYVCTAPMAPAQSSLVYPQYGYEPGAVATFECNPGYTSQGCPRAVCNGTTGDWEFNNVTCMHHCPNGWVAFKTSCYLFCNDARRSFNKSRDFCQDVGGYLVQVNDAEENEFIKDTLIELNAYLKLKECRRLEFLSATVCQSAQSDFNENYWMGLTDAASEGTFRWIVDNSESTFFDWEPTEPFFHYRIKEDCVAFSGRCRAYQWNDLKCKKRKRAVCERAPGI